MRKILLVLLLCLVTSCALGQGGPPMLTDDPGTPGNGRWEINLATILAHSPNEWALDAPALDLNYGWGDHLQLTLQTSVALLKRSDHGLIGGLGGTEAAVKWRFLDEESSGVDLSMFPRILFNVVPSSARRGLADDGTRFQVPFQAAKKIGHFAFGTEFGPLLSSVGPGEWIYGVVAGTEVTRTTSVMVEVHATTRPDLTRDVVVLNCGWRRILNEHAIWIGSLGQDSFRRSSAARDNRLLWRPARLLSFELIWSKKIRIGERIS